MRRASFTGTNFRRRQKMEGVGGRKFFAREPFAERLSFVKNFA